MRDICCMENFLTWPFYPFLPLIKNDGDLGLLFDAKRTLGLENCEHVVFLCNILDLELYESPLEFIERCPKEKHVSFEDIKKNGWKID